MVGKVPQSIIGILRNSVIIVTERVYHMAMIWASNRKSCSFFLHCLGYQSMSVILKFLDFIEIVSFTIIDIVRSILKTWSLKNVLDLPPVIEWFTDKDRCRNVFNQILTYNTVMKIIRISCYTFLIWGCHLLISKINHHLNLFFKLVLSCNHWWIINGKSWIRKSLYL